MTNTPLHFTQCESCVLRRQLCEAANLFEEKVIELSTIKDAGCSLQNINDFSKVCQSLLDGILDNIPAQACSIMLFDEERDQLFLAAASDPADNRYVLDVKDILSRKDLLYSFKSGEGVAGSAIQQREAVLENNIEGSSRGGWGLHAGIRAGSQISVPLIIREKPFGVLNLWHEEKNIFRERHLQLLQILSNFVALVVHASLEHEKLKASEEMYRIISENSNDGIIILQNELHIYTNPRYREITGYSARELLTTSFQALVGDCEPVDPTIACRLPLDFSALQEPLETQMTTRHGGRISVEISTSRIEYNGTEAVIAIVRDLTDRKRLEEQLLQAQKMEAIGTLAGGIAHDFNNLLQAILGYGELLMRDTDQGDRHYRKLQQIVSVAKRGAQLTHQLLTFSRKIEAEPQFIDLNHQIEELRDLLVRIIPKMIDIEIYLAHNLRIVSVDPTQIEQVIINLVVNARDAMPDGGRLLIETSNVILDEEYCRSNLEISPGDYVLLQITDTGFGMDRETLQHIFEPFYTTKEIGKGTGLGLAIAYGIIIKHDGHIVCESEPGVGTTFRIYLPAVEPPDEAA